MSKSLLAGRLLPAVGGRFSGRHPARQLPEPVGRFWGPVKNGKDLVSEAPLTQGLRDLTRRPRGVRTDNYSDAVCAGMS